MTVDGVMILKNDVWHITNDNVNRFYFAANCANYISGGGASTTDNCFVVYGSAAVSYATDLAILNNGNIGIFNINNSAYKLHVNGTTYFQGYCIIGGDLKVKGNLEPNGTCSTYVTSVANNGTAWDYIGVQVNSSQGSSYQYPICIMHGSFTGFHRCIIDNEWFDNENPQQFKDGYVGRVVISSEKIATDTKQNPIGIKIW